MIQAKKELLEALGAALAQIEPNAPPAPAFESPKQASHGDLACTAAMAMARSLKKNPREVAAALVDALKRQPAVERWVDALEIAGPGFINLRLKDGAKQATVACFALSLSRRLMKPGPAISSDSTQRSVSYTHLTLPTILRV